MIISLLGTISYTSWGRREKVLNLVLNKNLIRKIEKKIERNLFFLSKLSLPPLIVCIINYSHCKKSSFSHDCEILKTELISLFDLMTINY